MDASDWLKRYGEGKTSLKFIHRRIFLTDKPSDWVAMIQQETKKKDEEKDEVKEHASSIVKCNAVLSKSSSSNYAGNFSYYIQGKGKERANGVYGKISKNITSLYSKNRPKLVQYFNDFFVLGKVACAFNSKSKLKTDMGTAFAGCGFPYAWEAHHMIPGEVFTCMIKGETADTRIFSAEQYLLLTMCDYDINNGNNLIALPTNRMDFFQPTHDLIQHPSSHSEYTGHVKTEMTELSDKLDELGSELDKPHPDIVVKLAESLKFLEDDLWDLLIKIGKTTVVSIVKNQELELSEYEQSLTKTQTAGGKTQYPFRALK